MIFQWILIVSIIGIPVEFYPFLTEQACRQAAQYMQAGDPEYKYNCKRTLRK